MNVYNYSSVCYVVVKCKVFERDNYLECRLFTLEHSSKGHAEQQFHA